MTGNRSIHQGVILRPITWPPAFVHSSNPVLPGRFTEHRRSSSTRIWSRSWRGRGIRIAHQRCRSTTRYWAAKERQPHPAGFSL